MRAVARFTVVAALVATPVLGVATPASACADLEGDCLVNCVVDLVTKGSCRL